MVAKKSSKRVRKISTPLKIVVGLLAVILILAVLDLTNTITLLHKTTPTTKRVVVVGKPVQAPVTKATAGSQTASQKTNTNDNLVANGTITSTNGTAVPNTNPSQWVTSASGIITVKSPVANEQLASGSTLAGSAKVSQVDYTLIDNVVGVIDTGSLNVVNGNFSGTLNFQPQGTGGRLDVYTTNSQGVEYNEVQINVSF